MEISNVTQHSSGSMAGQCTDVKRAIEAAIQFYGFQDLVRVTRSVFSHIRGEFIVTFDFPEQRYHRFLHGPSKARTVAEGVMQDYNRDYPGNLPAREP